MTAMEYFEVSGHGAPFFVRVDPDTRVAEVFDGDYPAQGWERDDQWYYEIYRNTHGIPVTAEAALATVERLAVATAA
jgi:hypothetical protein